MTTPTDTPRTDACPHCGAPYSSCGTNQAEGAEEDSRTELCFQRYARQKAEAEVERLKALLQEARPVLRHTAMYCFDAVNCICGTEYLEERIDEALNPTDK